MCVLVMQWLRKARAGVEPHTRTESHKGRTINSRPVKFVESAFLEILCVYISDDSLGNMILLLQLLLISPLSKLQVSVVI